MTDTNNIFWTKEPYVLIDNDKIKNLWPKENMSYVEKLNSITRLIIILTVLGFLISKSARIIIAALITLGIIYFLYTTHENKLKEKESFLKEGFSNEKTYNKIKKNFKPISTQNPLGNVMLQEINGDPNRKPAPPAFNPNAEKEINEKTKDAVAIINSDNSGIKDKIFKDLGDSFLFDKSFMRNFYSTSNTKVPNDQNSFAKFLYGDMNSCKDIWSDDKNHEFACEKGNYRKYPGY
jgi:hypothetical protein